MSKLSKEEIYDFLKPRISATGTLESISTYCPECDVEHRITIQDNSTYTETTHCHNMACKKGEFNILENIESARYERQVKA